MATSEKVYGNRSTKVVHAQTRNDRCRASEIKSENLVWFKDVGEAEACGYMLCATCYPHGLED